jgi:hypothetical protein
VALLLLSGLAASYLSWRIAHHSLIGYRWRLIILMAIWIVPWVAGAAAASRIAAKKVALALILVLAISARLVAATGSYPSISNDIFRYGWDAHIQLSGIDPYRYPPNSPQIERLRIAPYWPSPLGCYLLHTRAGCTIINRPSARTIYPAVAEAWFVVVTVLYPGNSDSRPWQLAGGFIDDMTIVLLMLFLRRSGRDARHAAWYALSPIPIVEYAGNGHVDGLALMLLVAALLALQRQRSVLAGTLIGLATMVKLYPGIALVAALRQGRWRLVGAAVATIILTELPHVVVVGTHVLGYLPGYLKEEHYDSGNRFLLLGLLPLHGKAVTALAVAVVAAACVWVWWSSVPAATGLAVLLAVAVLVATPVQPWYAVALAGVGAAIDANWLVLPAMAGEVYYATVILDDPHQVGYGRLSYGLALVAIAGFIVWRRRPRAVVSVPVGRYL